jgi:hypothetical protein
MADDRLEKLAFRWGLVGFGMQLFYLLYVFLDLAEADTSSFFAAETVDRVALRFGQLKPPMFKSPGFEWIIWLYVIVLVVCLLVVWGLALRSFLRSPTTDR